MNTALATDRTSPPAHIVELVDRTRREQGLPPRIEDDVTLRRVAEIFKGEGRRHEPTE